MVDGEGPYEGSALLWALGLRAERRAPGALTARSLIGVDPAEAIAAVFRAGQDNLQRPGAAREALGRPRQGDARRATAARPSS